MVLTQLDSVNIHADINAVRVFCWFCFKDK